MWCCIMVSSSTNLFPDGEDSIQEEAFPRGSTGPRPRWAELLTTCQPKNRANDCTVLIWCWEICNSVNRYIRQRASNQLNSSSSSNFNSSILLIIQTNNSPISWFQLFNATANNASALLKCDYLAENEIAQFLGFVRHLKNTTVATDAF